MESNFLLQFCNIRGLACNFHSVEAHLNSERPAILALSETQVVGDDINYRDQDSSSTFVESTPVSASTFLKFD